MEKQRWQVSLNFDIEAPDEKSAKQEADRLGGAIAEKFNLDEHTPHQVTMATDTVAAGSKSGSSTKS